MTRQLETCKSPDGSVRTAPARELYKDGVQSGGGPGEAKPSERDP